MKKTVDINVYDKSIPLEERVSFVSEKLTKHLSLFLSGDKSKRRIAKLKRRASDAAHVMFESHPELREEGSLCRYFVARSGRRKGLKGAELSRYVELEYANGTWYKHVPEEVIAQGVSLP